MRHENEQWKYISPSDFVPGEYAVVGRRRTFPDGRHDIVCIITIIIIM